ncbi:hypothetical protein K474DRAFT_1675880 [Panus rudis PR-1116 ss-1]|nr:hypothetical protein K474DRAFT_1675880 [Panus rudis PR-1116 ss-1]
MRASIYSALSLVALFTVGQVSALPSPDASVEARNASPSPALQARSPAPSGAYKKRSMTKRQQRPLSPVEELSRQLCPFGMSVCPISSSSSPSTLLGWIHDGYECVYHDSDLNSCGGCGTVNVSHDCTTIPNAVGVSCVSGQCRVDSCKSGFTLAEDGKTCVQS